MWFIGWIILGIIVGWIVGQIVANGGKGVIVNMVLGIIGALIGGFVFDRLGGAPATGFNFWSLCVAVIGAIVMLLLYHTISGPRRTF